MEKRTLGGSLEVSAIGLGCMTMNTNLFGTPSGSRDDMIAAAPAGELSAAVSPN